MAPKNAEPKKHKVPASSITPADRPGEVFPIVGIGASAGGLAAFEAFFSGLPATTDSGMAFVLVQHLAPDHKSVLCELVKRYTRMQVFEVEDEMVVQPNCVYIIPPNRDLGLLNGTLQLMEPSAPRGQRLPIDFFFRSLAQDQHERAIGIVLSGTGSDGTKGVRAIKAEGGMVMAQTPHSTTYDGMPRSAIATGLVDYTLLPVEMPAQLIAYVAHTTGRIVLPNTTSITPKTENALKKIFILLRNQTGHDFSQYKPNTIQRRTERRMGVHQIETIEAYLKYLQQTPEEVEALFRDLLIGVTSFFRDPEVFKKLDEQIIPKIFANKPAGSAIRIWSPGCATGEEAYSIAILLQEHLEALKQNFKIQIFATNIDSRAIATARAGCYPASIATDISPERLAHYFVTEPTGSTYTINKNIRDMLIFSEQNVISDPPFSKLDLISCRNLLIYMGGDLQKKLIPLFHYALNPCGILLLGTSETVGECGDLFAMLDRKLKLYQRKEDMLDVRYSSLATFLSATAVQGERLPQPVNKGLSVSLPVRELTQTMLVQQMAPSGAFNTNHTGIYLEPPPGEAGIDNILQLAREASRLGFTTINLSIYQEAADRVGQETDADSDRVAEAGTSPDTDAHIAALRQELRAREHYIQSTREELETSNEELKSSNEEMQSMNEELQSTNEELETSKEELQSVNEELATVNAELQTKVIDLSRANNDMNNLLAGMGIATVFVDRQLRILRFTPSATEIINLIPSDVGRPVGHTVSNLKNYDTLSEDAQDVLNTLIPKELEVQAIEGRWFAMRIQPYRTLYDNIEGVVISFVDITKMKKAHEIIRNSEAMLRRLAVEVRDAHDAITVQDLQGQILTWNSAAERMYGWSEKEALAMNSRDRVPENRREHEMAIVQQLARAEVLEPYRTERLAKDGKVIAVWLTATVLVDTEGKAYAVATTERT